MLPVFFPCAKVNLQILGEVWIPLHERVSDIPLRRGSIARDGFLDRRRGRRGNPYSVLFCASLYLLDEDLQACRALRRSSAHLLNDEQVRIKLRDEAGNKALSLCEETTCRRPMSKGMDPEIE